MEDYCTQRHTGRVHRNHEVRKREMEEVYHYELPPMV